MSDNDVIWCLVCDEFYSESRLDVFQHLKEEHTLRERMISNIERGAEPEDTHA